MAKRKRRVYRDALGRFISRAEWSRQQSQVRRRLRGGPRKGRYTAEEEQILDDVRRAQRGVRPGRGTEFELSIRYKGHGRAAMHLTVRVRLDRDMGTDEARLLTERALRQHVAPPGITLRALDWQRGKKTKRYRATPDVLEDFGAVFREAEQTRFGRVRKER